MVEVIFTAELVFADIQERVQERVGSALRILQLRQAVAGIESGVHVVLVPAKELVPPPAP